MRLHLLLLLIVGFSFSACKKYNLKQPSHLSLKWVVVNNTDDSMGEVKNAFFYASSINITGEREEGDAINLIQEIPSEKISITSQSFFAVKVDVPMGDYTALNVKLNFAPLEGNNFGINGEATVLGTPVKFVVEWTKLESIVFKSLEKLEFKKKKDYDLSLCLDINKLMVGITQQDWNSASVSLEPDGATVSIQELKNHNLFAKIQANLSNAVYIGTN